MTHNHHWTIKGLLMFGWEKTKEHYLFILGLIVGVIILEAITSWIPVVKTIVSFLVTIAVISVFLDMVKGHAPHYKDLLKPFGNYKITWHYFLGTLLLVLGFGLLAGIAAILALPSLAIHSYLPFAFVIGILIGCVALYAAVRVQFFRYYIVEDENINPVEAIKKSWHITRNRFWRLFGFIVVLGLLNLLGLIALVIGLLFTIPISIIAYTKLYKDLSSEAHSHHTVAAN